MTIAVLIVVGFIGFLGSSLIDTSGQEAEAGIWHFYDCTFDEQGRIKSCREIVYHGTTSH